MVSGIMGSVDGMGRQKHDITLLDGITSSCRSAGIL